MEKFKGILWQRDVYTDSLITIFRYAGIIGSIVVVLYGAAVSVGLLPSDRLHFDAFIFIALMFLLVGITQFFDKKPVLGKALARLTSLHLLSIGVLLLVTGFQSPLTICWLLLFIASYFYFDKRAFYVSMALLIITAVADFAFVETLTLQYIATNLTMVGALVFVGYITMWLGHIQTQEHGAFVQTQMSESLQRDRMLSVINSMGDAILNTDDEGMIITYNAASLNLFDTNESLTGKKLDAILTLEDQEGNKVALFDTVSKRGSLVIREDLSFHFSDGEIMRLGINCTPVRTSYSANESQNGYIFIIRDITKTKSLEEERDEFISVVSHELRTPITIAEGTISNAQLLMGRNTPPEQIEQALKEAHEQTLYLAKMVNDLSTLSRAERGVAAEPEEIDIEQLVRSMYHEYQAQATEKKLHLNLDMKGKLGTLTTSRLYLEEILQNFITNAIKYTQEGSITLHISRNEKDVTFAVQDSGIGISKSDQRKIFHKFYRSEDYRTRETSGTGLGLYVVSKLVEKLGARIGVESRLNHGSTFSVTLGDMPQKKVATT